MDPGVLLAAYETWGSHCLARLNRMFAFAIYDSHDRSLFLARYRFAVKHLYYVQRDGTLYFAYEIKVLMTVPRLSRVRWSQLVGRVGGAVKL